MKVNVEIDCTPLEARQFFGLPDVQPMQTAVMENLQKQMMANIEKVSPEALMQSWFTFDPKIAERFQDMFVTMAGLGGVRATESAGFAAANVIGIGINGTDAIGELKKPDSGFYGSMLPSPHIEGYNTASMMYEWVTTGKEPAKYTAMDDVTLITRDNFKQELEKIGLWN